LHGHGVGEKDTASWVEPCSRRIIGHSLHHL
jgi:hypothetical protein